MDLLKVMNNEITLKTLNHLQERRTITEDHENFNKIQLESEQRQIQFDPYLLKNTSMGLF
jgi:hypothetical protein